MNITKHVTMPKHEILTAEENEQLLEKLKLADNKTITFRCRI
ncbi:putative RNA polymerase, subunit H/Rpb5, RPB5-like RNA polymerase subunit superfamily [Helianthus annuus]|uniref:RNA polymerase, subunit H/Rpb5, RPB5-like RNA polymerase subunit superfamily n=1 Tax=Helianthus annuus TaxID=4232 RepID=A0A9K3E5M4_HELAN|nr:putative RNA polymerase, subunit H/Rpb5, RPB5-like RNA polymerase subunit superfamily [Helianthus annuus]